MVPHAHIFASKVPRSLNRTDNSLAANDWECQRFDGLQVERGRTTGESVERRAEMIDALIPLTRAPIISQTKTKPTTMKTKAIIIRVAMAALGFSCAQVSAMLPLGELTRAINPAQQAAINSARTNSVKAIDQHVFQVQMSIKSENDVTKVKKLADEYIQQAQEKLKAAADREAGLMEKEARLTNSEQFYSASTVIGLVTTVIGGLTSLRGWRSSRLENRKTELEISKLEEELSQMKQKGTSVL